MVRSLVALIVSVHVCGSLSVAAVAGDASTVMVIADSRTDGPAGRLACRQIGHWPTAAGRLIVEPDLLGIAVNHAEHRPDWLIVLRESYDDRRSIPAADGWTLRGVGPVDQVGEILRTTLKTINGPIEKAEEQWQSGSLPPTEWARFAALVGDRTGIIVVSTSAKLVRSNRLWRRVRQQRVAVHAILRELGVITTEVSPDLMTPPRNGSRKGKACVAIYDGPGAVSSSGHDPLWILRSLAHLGWLEASLVGPAEIQSGALDQFDAVLFGGGGSTAQANSLGAEGRERVRRFVHNGGGYVGICAGAFLASCNKDIYLAIINARMPAGTGTAIVPLNFTAEAEAIVATHGTHDAKYSGGSRAMVAADRPDLPPFQPLATFAADASSKTKLSGAVAIACGEYGKGKVIVFSPHCERYPGPQETFWRALARCCSVDLSGVELPTTP